MEKITKVKMTSRVKGIEKNDDRYEITFYHSTRNFYLGLNSPNILEPLRNSKNKEVPVIFTFNGKTGLIVEVE